jgi:hypothetical protein
MRRSSVRPSPLRNSFLALALAVCSLSPPIVAQQHHLSVPRADGHSTPLLLYPGIVFPERAWSGIHKPVLILTGIRDQSLRGGPQARQLPWHNLPGTPSHCQWMGVITGATHMNFAGNGFGHEKVEPLVTNTIASFLAGVQQYACTIPAPIDGMPLQAK